MPVYGQQEQGIHRLAKNMTLRKPPQHTGRKLDLELQRAHQRFAKTRSEVRDILQVAREISEASRNRVMASMKISA